MKLKVSARKFSCSILPCGFTHFSCLLKFPISFLLYHTLPLSQFPPSSTLNFLSLSKTISARRLDPEVQCVGERNDTLVVSQRRHNTIGSRMVTGRIHTIIFEPEGRRVQSSIDVLTIARENQRVREEERR